MIMKSAKKASPILKCKLEETKQYLKNLPQWKMKKTLRIFLIRLVPLGPLCILALVAFGLDLAHGLEIKFILFLLNQ